MTDDIRIMISEEEIDNRVRELGEQISRDYSGKTVHMICVLKGGVYFMTALSNRIDESVPVSCSIEAQKAYKNASLSVIKGDTHCYDFHLEDVVSAVRSWMTSTFCL